MERAGRHRLSPPSTIRTRVDVLKVVGGFVVIQTGGIDCVACKSGGPH